MIKNDNRVIIHLTHTQGGTIYDMPKLRTNNDNDAFCASCGQKLGISVTPNPVPYNQEFYGAPDASVSGFAFVSLVLGIASILLCFVIPMLPIAIGIAGFVFGIISIKKSTKKNIPYC